VITVRAFSQDAQADVDFGVGMGCHLSSNFQKLAKFRVM